MKKYFSKIIPLATLLLLLSCAREEHESFVETAAVPQILQASLENEFDPERDDTGT